MASQIPVVVDFETEGIGPRPLYYPPKPVGVAIKWPGLRSKYWAWGHPTQNNCTYAQAKRELKRAWKHVAGVLFHNAAFDVSVANVFFELPWLAWDRIQDTKLLAFLDDPYKRRIGLKDLAEEFLGIIPAERDLVQEWILKNVPEMKGKKKGWAAYICRAPGKLVGKYASADDDMTIGLWKYYASVRSGMPQAYERERRLLEPLESMSTVGIPMALEVHELAEQMPKRRERLDVWIRKRLGVSTSFDLQKKNPLCDAIEDAGLVEEWILTGKSGARSLAHEDFAEVCLDPVFAEALYQRSLMKTLGTTFLQRWSDDMEETGRFHITWNSTTGMHGDGTGSRVGARTGRISATPNMMNVSKAAPPVSVVSNLEIPNLRTQIKSKRGRRLGVADYSQQEPRQAADRAGGALAQQYRDNPKLDFHANTQRLMAEIGAQVTRDTSKTLGLAVLYALGLDALGFRLGVDRSAASTLRKQFRTALPDITALEKELKRMWEAGEPIVTWGNRIVCCEAPSASGRSFAYRALNYYCQGSSADQIKQAIIDYWENPKREADLILCVHDELVIETPSKIAKRELALLKSTMEGVGPFTVPFTADGGIGATWWEAKP